jgi:selenide,water dikinase
MKRLVLLGGGHSHVHVLDALARKPPAGVPRGFPSVIETTLVSPYPHQVYSGMLPGWLAGHYHLRDCLIPIDVLAQRAGVVHHRATAIGFDPATQRVFCSDGAAFDYDVLSIDTGAVLDLTALPGAAQHALPVRPIERFIQGCTSLVEHVQARPRTVITLVGGGAAGIELILALRRRLRRHVREGRAVLQLVSASERLLPGHPRGVGRRLEAQLAAGGILYYPERSVAAFHAGGLMLHTGEQLESDINLVATGASAAAWPKRAGLATDAGGFISVNSFLQSTSHANVFAAGDIASMVDQPRPKSGVYAVHAGPPLAENLRRMLEGRPLKRHVPQKRALYLIGTGGHHAIASWGPFSWQGRWVWRWKDRIDRAFIARFPGDLPAEANHGDSLRS